MTSTVRSRPFRPKASRLSSKPRAAERRPSAPRQQSGKRRSALLAARNQAPSEPGPPQASEEDYLGGAGNDAPPPKGGVSLLKARAMQTSEAIEQRRRLFKRLNTAKSVKGLYRALLIHPGLEADERRLVAHLDRLIEMQTDAVQSATRQLWPDAGDGERPPGALVSKINNAISHLLNHEWERAVAPIADDDQAPAPEIDTEALARIFAALVKRLPPSPDEVFEETTDSLDRRITESVGATKVYVPLSVVREDLRGKEVLWPVFFGRREYGEALDMVLSHLAAEATRVTDALIGNEDLASYYGTTYRSVFNVLSDVAATAIRSSASRIKREVNAVRKTGDPERKQSLFMAADEADGLMIKSVLDDIDRAVGHIYPEAGAPAHHKGMDEHGRIAPA